MPLLRITCAEAVQQALFECITWSDQETSRGSSDALQLYMYYMLLVTDLDLLFKVMLVIGVALVKGTLVSPPCLNAFSSAVWCACCYLPQELFPLSLTVSRICKTSHYQKIDSEPSQRAAG